MNSTQIVEMEADLLVKADWNYKTDGSEQQIGKLMESIQVDKSVGVLAIRELEKDKFEVIDGNHRLEAIKRLGWKKVPCENFGEISKGMAVTIARRRNHKWFDDDLLEYAKLFKEDVLKEFSIQDLEEFMPETREEMLNYERMLDFDWDEFEPDPVYDEDNLKTVKVVIPEEVYNMWIKWKGQVKEVNGYETDSKAFEFALIEAINSEIRESNG